MKQHHYQELKQSAIADDVIEANFHSASGYEGFAKFINVCNPKNKQQGTQVCDSQTNHRYSHLYEGYWYANSWCPLSNSHDFQQIKPDFPMVRLVTTKGTEKYKQPVELNHRPDKRYKPSEKGYLLGTRQTIISIAKALQITHKLPHNESGSLYLEAISAMSPREKYQWCLENGAFDLFAFEPIKYETPAGNGTPFIYLDIPLPVLEQIASEYDLSLPFGYKTWNVGDKWQWVKNHPQIPLFITEGIKKAASLISHGKIAIASFSITTHSEKAGEGKSSWHTNIKPELLWLLQKKSGRKTVEQNTQSIRDTVLQERLIYLVFDAADVKESSRKAVQRETKKLAKKLKKYGIVKVITWEDQSCKGIDDFIFKHGIQGLDKIIENAINFNQLWKKEIANYGRQLNANIKINQRYLSPQLITQARRDGFKLLCIKSQQNTGKTSSYSQSLEEYKQINNQSSISAQEQNISYQIGQSVKIKVGLSIYDSIVLGYDETNNKYQCSFHEGYITRDISQIIDNNPLNQYSFYQSNATINVGQIIHNDPLNQYSFHQSNATTNVGPIINNDQLIDRQGFNHSGKLINNQPLELPDNLITYGLTHRQSLAWNLADRLNLDCYLSNIIPLQSKGIMVCADSSLIIPEGKNFTDLVIDESEQVAWHLLASATDIRHQRISKIERIVNHGQTVLNSHGMITIMDANLSDTGVKFYQTLFGISNNETLVIENLHQPFAGVRDCYIYDNVESLRHQIIQSIEKGQRIIIHTSGQKESSTHGTINIEKEIIARFPALSSQIYRLDKESLGDSNHLSYQILSDLERLKQAKIIIASSCINTGVSLDEEIVGTFDAIFGIFYGNYPLTDFEQAIERYRGDCPRHIYLKNASSERINLGSSKYSDLLTNIIGQTNNIHTLLQDNFNCDLAMDLVKFYCKFASMINNDYQHLKDNFICHLKQKGYTIYEGKKLPLKHCQNLKKVYQSIKDESENEFQLRVDEVDLPSPPRLEELEKSKTKTKQECIEEYKGKLARRYKTNKITRELIALDREGFYPQLLLRFWLSFGQTEAIKRDKRVLTKYVEDNESKGYAIDFNSKVKSPQTVLLNHIGLDNILGSILNLQTQEILIMLLSMQVNPLWFKLVNTKRLAGWITELDIIPLLSFRMDAMVKKAFKQVLNIDLDKQQTPIQLLRMILRRVGYGIDYVGRYGSRCARRSRTGGGRHRYYCMYDSISNELWNEIFNSWSFYESSENEQFQYHHKQVA